MQKREMGEAEKAKTKDRMSKMPKLQQSGKKPTDR